MNKARTYERLPGLASARVHELSGPSAMAFALLMARKGDTILSGPSHWLSALHPAAIARFCDPNRVLHALSSLEADMLWSAETALRSGAASTVIVATERSPTLTNFRRLQLAALAGKSLGLIIANRPAASSAAETRWHCTPSYTEEQGGFRIHASLYKNKKGIVGSWVLNVSGEKNSMHLDAAPVGEPVRPERIAG